MILARLTYKFLTAVKLPTDYGPKIKAQKSDFTCPQILYDNNNIQTITIFIKSLKSGKLRYRYISSIQVSRSTRSNQSRANWKLFNRTGREREIKPLVDSWEDANFPIVQWRPVAQP